MPVCPESAGLILRVMYQSGVPLAQRIARWTSNPKVLGSIPRWDEKSFDFLMLATNDQQTFWIYPSHSFLSVVVITCASHAQGRRFEPGRKQSLCFTSLTYLSKKMENQ